MAGTTSSQVRYLPSQVCEVMTEPSVEASLPTMIVVQFSAYPGPSGSISFVICPAARSGNIASRRINPVLKVADVLWFFMIKLFADKNSRVVHINAFKDNILQHNAATSLPCMKFPDHGKTCHSC